MYVFELLHSKRMSRIIIQLNRNQHQNLFNKSPQTVNSSRIVWVQGEVDEMQIYIFCRNCIPNLEVTVLALMVPNSYARLPEKMWTKKPNKKQHAGLFESHQCQFRPVLGCKLMAEVRGWKCVVLSQLRESRKRKKS